MHEVSEGNTRQGVNTENTLQRVRADNESIKENHETLTLKHTKNIFSLFKGAPKVVVGKDIILTTDIAISLTDNAIDEVKKVVDENNIEMGSTASFDKLASRSINGETFLTDGIVVIKVDSSSLEHIRSEYKTKSSHNA